MINCKKHILAMVCFSLVVPAVSFAEAPVVDDSDNFAIMDEQQTAVRPKYDEMPIENAEIDGARAEKYQMDMPQSDDGPALAKDDASNEPSLAQNSVRSSANLIERVQTLQKELQELRGQFEVQAHELKKLQEQQLTFYKDLDSRISSTTGKSGAPIALNATKTTTAPATKSTVKSQVTTKNTPVVVANTSKSNPADEQISYLAAYELVKEKHYDEALKAMNTFAQKYPQSGYSANVHYWLGELYMVKKDYSRAITHFDTVVQKFPSSEKSAASMLKSGYAYGALGNNQEAQKRLHLVVKTYPGTSTAQLANLKLESINAL